MFRLADPGDDYPGWIEVRVPGADAPLRHPVRWRWLPDDEINPLLAASPSALLRRVVVGWDAVHDHDGGAIDFSPESLEALLNVAYWRRAATDAYLRFVAGLPEKNSAPPPAAGGAAVNGVSGSSPSTRVR